MPTIGLSMTIVLGAEETDVGTVSSLGSVLRAGLGGESGRQVARRARLRASWMVASQARGAANGSGLRCRSDQVR